MKSYLAVYSGNAYAEGSTFSAGRSNINGFVQFQSDETDDSKLLILAKNSATSLNRGLFDLQLTIDKLVEVFRTIK